VWLIRGVEVVAALACLATLVGFLSRFTWLGELACHFRRQYAWVLLVSVLCLFFVRRWPEGLIAFACLLVNLFCILPFYSTQTRRSTQHQTIRALLLNLFSSNRRYERVRRLIHETNPDVLILVEVTELWLKALQDIRASYPFSKVVTLRGGFGILLLSRVDVERAEVVRIGAVGLPSIVAHLHINQRLLTLIATHPLAPTTPYKAWLRNRQLQSIAAFVQRQSGAVMVLGDLNSSSWSHAFKDFLHVSRLRDSRVGFGLQPTWPVGMPLVRIPIDHCLVSSHVVVHRRRVGPPVGSDHHPVIVEFSIDSSA